MKILKKVLAFCFEQISRIKIINFIPNYQPIVNDSFFSVNLPRDSKISEAYNVVLAALAAGPR